ncbi:MAG: hypothetical protein K0R73_688 [Candidatus Midichloriaceae bacterium]|jgi:hypothetical protein|nr:hypothetical protein [Candidatus Midichloriaceae bacterium]
MRNSGAISRVERSIFNFLRANFSEYTGWITTENPLIRFQVEQMKMLTMIIQVVRNSMIEKASTYGVQNPFLLPYYRGVNTLEAALYTPVQRQLHNRVNRTSTKPLGNYVQKRYYSEGPDKPSNAGGMIREYMCSAFQYMAKLDIFNKQKFASAIGGAFIGSVTGYFGVETFYPRSWREEKERALRRSIGTHTWEVQVKHITLPNLEHSDLIKRSEKIKKLEKVFAAMQTQYGIDELIIMGAAGVGKSELAEQYAREYQAKMAMMLPGEKRTVKIFRSDNSSNIDMLADQYRDFAKELGIAIQEYGDKQLPKLIQEVHKKLEDRPGWLLVFDDFDDYNKIKDFIPQNGVQKGQVIITCREPKVTQEKKYTIGIIDAGSQEYRLSRKEINEIFSKILGDKHEHYNKDQGARERLGATLKYLPNAIKKAASYIKASQHFEKDPNVKQGITTIEEYSSIINEKIKQNAKVRANNTDIRDNDIKEEDVNKAVNELSLELLKESDKLAWEVINFSSCLQPDCIQLELLRKKFVQEEKINPAIFDEAISSILKLSLMEEKADGALKLHRSVITMLQKEQNNIIEFFRKNFKRDNTTPNARNSNSLFMTHLLEIQSRLSTGFSEKNLHEMDTANMVDYCYFNVIASSYYMMTGQSVKARELLEHNKILFEKRSNNKDQAEYEHLLKDDIALLTVYSQTLYHLGRTYFDIGKKATETPDHYYKCLLRAKEIRQFIDEKAKNNGILKKRDSAYNDFNMDSILVERNGTLEFIRKHYEMFKDKKLEDVAERYAELAKTLIEQKDGTKKVDEKNQNSCKSERFRTRIKIAQNSSNLKYRVEQCIEAAAEMYNDSEGAIIKGRLYLPERKEDTVDYKKILAKLQEKSDTRKAKYINDLAKLMCVMNEYDAAKECYTAAIEAEIVPSLELAESYLSLAEIHNKERNHSLAVSALERCVKVQREIGMSKSHEQHNAAMLIKELIDHPEAEVATQQYVLDYYDYNKKGSYLER